MRRTIFVPAFVLMLGFATIAAIVGLQHRAGANRGAQLQLATLRVELSQLQEAPLKSSPTTGGSLKLGRQLMDTGQQRITSALSELQHESPITGLDGLNQPLRENFATLEEIIALSESSLDFNASAARAAELIGVATVQLHAANAVLDSASREYDQRASTADRRATVGAVIAIVLLLAAFALLYRRSERSRSVAERLAYENARLATANGEEARTDALTGLRNRRALIDDLQAVADAGEQRLLALFDLDGFKQYNDTFGHPAGDVLLALLGDRLKLALDGVGTAYRMGGDEFCILIDDDRSARPIVSAAAEALSESGDAFVIGCSYGTASLPAEAVSPEQALRLADQRMYAHKTAGRASATRQSSDVLLQVLSERNAELREHLGDVARLAELTAEQLGLPEAEIARIALAAELHDVGKTAIPDAILNKPGPLDEREWEFMYRHTIIGERILLAAPSLASTAALVRSSHERFDGAGYPDRLAGAEIPVGSSIIAICDAYDAMITDRPYRTAMSSADALAELHACAGAQFDPAVVATFCRLATELQLSGAVR